MLFSSARTMMAVLAMTWFWSSPGLASDSKPKPKNVEIKLPKAKESLLAKSSFQIEGKVKAASGGEAPAVVLIRVIKEGGTKLQVASWGIGLGEDTPESSFLRNEDGYEFKVKMNAPGEAGRYSIDATVYTPGKDAAGKTKVVEEKSDPVEVKVVN